MKGNTTVGTKIESELPALSFISALVLECEETANSIAQLHKEEADAWRMRYLTLTETLIESVNGNDIPIEFVVEQAKLYSSVAATQLRADPSNI